GAVAGVIWRWLGLSILVSGALYWFRTIWRMADRRVPLAFLLFLPLAIKNLNNGQINLPLVGLTLAGSAAVIQQRWTVAAAAFMLASSVKPYLFAIVLLMLLVQPRPLTGRLLVFCILGLAFPFLCQRPNYVIDQYVNWWHHVSTDDRSWMDARGCYRDL